MENTGKLSAERVVGNNVAPEAKVERRKIKISEILTLLGEGETREEIRVYLGISKAELAYIFKHEKLKGVKTAKKRSFTLVDDTAELVDDTAEEVITQEENYTEIQDAEEKQDGPKMVLNLTEKTEAVEEVLEKKATWNS